MRNLYHEFFFKISGKYHFIRYQSNYESITVDKIDINDWASSTCVLRSEKLHNTASCWIHHAGIALGNLYQTTEEFFKAFLQKYSVFVQLDLSIFFHHCCGIRTQSSEVHIARSNFFSLSGSFEEKLIKIIINRLVPKMLGLASPSGTHHWSIRTNSSWNYYWDEPLSETIYVLIQLSHWTKVLPLWIHPNSVSRCMEQIVYQCHSKINDNLTM